MPSSDTAEKILDIAERAARQGGYNAFSFRDIAAEIGIKSASVHYHFPTKEALGEALAARYTDRFLAALGSPTDAAPDVMIRRYIEAFSNALKNDGLMCLCGMFGAEIEGLPRPVAKTTRDFFARNFVWLRAVYASQGQTSERSKAAAAQLIAILEGAVILARAMDDHTLFDAATADLTGAK
ncbi:TetR/AcrR family transcriptional regulator [Cognatishimia sp. SS12]|uniref:TetR/AcrR family transcriptional regulator n=1 Tax=Cognatishimia sp. SS12 TaxID=2979465 RepID=UPI00232CB254|nr:TetR/AcrR family transcriptional regulator [Cognatishimia sp. SS12]MDC0737595.1 TetR/AcrR family transcriptional regulator [Cognatishimia sp. SS12]